MSRAKYQDLALFEDTTDSNALKVVGGCEITVYEPGTTTPIAQTLYAGPTGGTTKTNPFDADLDGDVEFWIDTHQFVKVKFDGSTVDPLTYGAVTKDQQPTITVAVAPTTVAFDGTTSLKHTPPMSFSGDADSGWYRYAANQMDVGTPSLATLIAVDGTHTNVSYYPLLDTDQFVWVGAGNHSSNGFITMFRDGIARSTPQLGATEGFPSVSSSIAAYQGSTGKPIKQASDGVIRAQVVAAGNGGTTAGIVSHVLVSHGSDGSHFGITSHVTAGSGFTGLNKYFYASTLTAESEVSAAQSVVVGALISAQGRNPGDTIQAFEAVVGTRSDNYTLPAQRVVGIFATKDGEWSRRGTIDAIQLWARKGELGDVDHLANVQPFSHGVLMGLDSLLNWPFDTTSAIFKGSTGVPVDVANVTGDIINMGNTWVDGSVVKVRKRYDDVSGVLALNILGTGHIAIGADSPLSPIHIHDDSAASAMRFRGTSLIAAGAAYPGSATKKLVVHYWDGATWQSGWIGIN